MMENLNENASESISSQGLLVPFIIGEPVTPTKKKRRKIKDTYIIDEKGLRYNVTKKIRVKRLPEEEPVNLSRGEILEMINKIPEDIGRLKGRGLKYRALISFLYLTGARVSEIVGRKKTKIKINGIEEDVIPVTPLKKSQIELIKRINNQGQEEISFYIHNLITLKRRKFKARDILLRDKFEHEFLKHFYLYFKTLPNEDSIIFQMSRKQARDIVYKYTGKSPHYFRHYRNYDLLRYYKFDGFMLRAWNNWSSSRSADVYLDKLNPILIERIQSINNIDIG